MRGVRCDVRSYVVPGVERGGRLNIGLGVRMLEGQM